MKRRGEGDDEDGLDVVQGDASVELRRADGLRRTILCNALVDEGDHGLDLE
jgi:hypothetical protein